MMMPRRFIAPVLLTAFCFSPKALYAGAVHTCKDLKKRATSTEEDAKSLAPKSKEEKKLARCVVKSLNGHVGSEVIIKNHSNYIVATGKILKKRGSYAIVVVRRHERIRSGYQAFVKMSDEDHWTATMSPF